MRTKHILLLCHSELINDIRQAFQCDGRYSVRFTWVSSVDSLELIWSSVDAIVISVRGDAYTAGLNLLYKSVGLCLENKIVCLYDRECLGQEIRLLFHERFSRSTEDDIICPALKAGKVPPAKLVVERIFWHFGHS